MLTLHTIKPAVGSTSKKKKIGRGGKRGTYSGKGLKGQKSRSGVTGLKRLGMRQLIERTHKLKGFNSNKPKFEVVNLGILNNIFKNDEKVTPKILKQKKLVDKIENGVKILGNGQIEIKLNITGCQYSESAKQKIEKAGGSINN